MSQFPARRMEWLRAQVVGTVLSLVLCGTALGGDRVTLIAGGGELPPGNRAAEVKLEQPFGVALDQMGYAYIVEMTGNRILYVHRDGILRHLAGTGEKGNDGDGAAAIKAQFNGPHAIAMGPDNKLYVADTWNNRIRVIDRVIPRDTNFTIDPEQSTISNFAGTGTKGFSGDGGLAADAEFGGVYCIAFGTDGNMYVADLDNRRIRKIDMQSGIVTTIAGNGEKGVPEDGAIAVESPLVDPRAVAADSQGNVYILERSGHALRVVRKDGTIHTVAGTGEKGYSGDGGDALLATFNGPKHLTVDKNNRVWIADTENHVIRIFDPTTGLIERAIGTSEKGADGVGGDALNVQLAQPHGVLIDPRSEAAIISDSSNHRVLKTNKVMTESHGRVDETGTSQAVTVSDDAALLYSRQFFAMKPDGKIIGANDLVIQFDVVWSQLRLLRRIARPAEFVRVNMYLAREQDVEPARRELARRLEGEFAPAVSVVVTKLQHPEAVIAIDVVMASGSQGILSQRIVDHDLGGDEKLEPGQLGISDSRAVVGRTIFISGQAENGDDLAAATSNTLDSLYATLEHLGRDRTDVAHVKAFLTPMENSGEVLDALQDFFQGGKLLPPISLVEWQSTTPIEIELVVDGGPKEFDRPALEFQTPPGMTASPIYSRVATVNYGPIIFTSGLVARTTDSPIAEVEDVFTQLGGILEETGSDFHDLAKATYYVSTDGASQQLNALRPKYYDPERPPAASKAQVTSVGAANHGLTLDLIAVPSEK